MIIPIIGTIRNTVKRAEMDMEWQQRKNNAGKSLRMQMDPQIQRFQEDMKRMREANQMSSVDAKLKSGEDLTPEEIEFLKAKNPNLYREYVEIKMEKEAYERQLKTCKTKEDVQKLKINKMGGFLAAAKTIAHNANIPKGKKLELLEKLLRRIAGIENEHTAFVKSQQYVALPEEAERAEEVREHSQETVEVPKKPDVNQPDIDQPDIDRPNIPIEEGDTEGVEITAANLKHDTLPELQELSDAVYHKLRTGINDYIQVSVIK